MASRGERRWAPSERHCCAVVLVPCAADMDSVSFSVCCFLVHICCCFVSLLVVVDYDCPLQLFAFHRKWHQDGYRKGESDCPVACLLQRGGYAAVSRALGSAASVVQQTWSQEGMSVVCDLFFSFFLAALLSTHRCVQVYKKFEKEYEPEDRAYMWVHGLTQSKLSGGLHQLLPVRTNNLLERVWRVLKYERVFLFFLSSNGPTFLIFYFIFSPLHVGMTCWR